MFFMCFYRLIEDLLAPSRDVCSVRPKSKYRLRDDVDKRVVILKEEQGIKMERLLPLLVEADGRLW